MKEKDNELHETNNN